MAKSRSAIRVKTKQPVNLLMKPVKVEGEKLFKALAKAAVNLSTLQWSKVASDAVEAAASLSVSTTPEELAHTLLHRSLTRALFDVIGESSLRTVHDNSVAGKSLEKTLHEIMQIGEVELDRRFFDRPTSLPILPIVQSTLRKWLISSGLRDAAAENITNRLPSHFQAAVMEEWRRNSKRYQAVLLALDSPFAKAGDRELGWKNYDAWLQRQIEVSVFDEPFSLAQIYIPLNAYFVEHVKDKTECAKRRRSVVSLESELRHWLQHPDRNDLLRVISGGPGSGKSSFARIFAASVSAAGKTRVLFIELHEIDPTRDLADEIARFVRDEGILAVDPLDADDPEQDLLIILDGLDELATQGRVAADTARSFVREVERTLDRKNKQAIRLRVLLSGRELVVQENESEFRRPRQVLNLLPYKLVNDRDIGERLLSHTTEAEAGYHDPKKLMAVDLRNEWWKRYGQLTGNYQINELPDALRRPGLDEVTAQPLLNYLVALSFTRGKVKFDSNVNLNLVYADLIEAVHEGGYNRRRHASIRHMEFEDFQRILEEIALAAWHGDGRSTTVREIEEHCQSSGLGSLIGKFREGAEAGVTRLLAAFFFRRHGQRASGDATFVFTHKSFGEYLTACRITRAVERTVKRLEERQRSVEDGWDEREALTQWAAILGPSACTEYIKTFIKGEFRRRSPDAVDAARLKFAHLFTHMLTSGMPMDRLGARTFRENLYEARNAEESLLVVLSIAAALSQKVTSLNLAKRGTEFGAWFRRIQGQRTGPPSSLAATSLSFIGLREATLDICDFYGADLSGADLSKCQAHFSNFDNAQLVGANLAGAVFMSASFEGSNLTGANLSGANLIEVNFTGASLQNAVLAKAHCGHTNFKRAKLDEVEFSGAQLDTAILTGEQRKQAAANSRGKARMSRAPQSTKSRAR
jgi:uncharacterized protein YjbI with pentapeptide repeats